MKELKVLTAAIALLSLGLALTTGDSNEAALWVFSCLGWGLATLVIRGCPKP